MRFKTQLIAVAVAAAFVSGGAVSLYYRAQLAQACAETAAASAQHARDLKTISDAALTADREASANSQTAAQKIEALDAQLTKERQTHEADSRNYRAAFTAGTERVRVAVANCSAGSSGMPDAASATGIGDSAAASADLAPTIAERIFRVAADDQKR